MFLEYHNKEHGTNSYALDFLNRANDSSGGKWVKRELSREEVLSIVLPHHSNHKHESSTQELIPATGLTVKDTISRLIKLKDYSKNHPICWETLEMSKSSKSPIFLTATLLEENNDHGKLGNFSSPQLYHLDGLHRLVAWGLNGKYVSENYEPITAFIAG